MRKIFVAAFAFAGLVLTPAIASARPPAVSVHVAPAKNLDLHRTNLVKTRVESTLKKAEADISRGLRARTVTMREASILRTKIRAVRTELTRSLRSDRSISLREASTLEASLNSLEASVALALRPNRQFAHNAPGGRR